VTQRLPNQVSKIVELQGIHFQHLTVTQHLWTSSSFVWYAARFYYFSRSVSATFCSICNDIYSLSLSFATQCM